MKRPLLTAILCTVPLAVSACDSSDAHDGMDMNGDTTVTSTSPDDTSEQSTAAFNDADVSFAQTMIPHHEQAVEMAQLAIDPAREADAEVVDLAKRIQGAQGPEIELMSGWLEVWGRPTEMDMAGDDMAAMDGMMTDDELETLAAASGSDFDQMWLEMMTAHHQGAVTMAETEQASGSNPDAIALAGDIIASQQAEIDEMQRLLPG